MSDAEESGAVGVKRDEAPPGRARGNSKRAAGAPRSGPVHVFAIFDSEHDGDLYELLRAQSQSPGSGFEVTGGSDGSKDPDVWEKTVRRRIREADQVIVICSQHTEASARVHAELRIAQDEGSPYFLLWGRRAFMCTKPIGAKPTEGMFSWTPEIVGDQIALALRTACSEATAENLRRPTWKAATTL